MIDLVSGVMILDNQDLWSKFLSLLQQKINPITFNTWFKPLKLHEIDTLKNKKPTESVIKFFQRKMRKIEVIKQKKWKVLSLKYD